MIKIELNGVEYYRRANSFGYGHEIISLTKIDEKHSKRKCIFKSYNKELVRELMIRIKDGILPDFPDTSYEVPPLKVLIYRSKHFTYHYSVPTYESLVKACRKILKDEYRTSIEHMKSTGVTNDTGVESQEEIDSIPVETIRTEVQARWDKYQKRLREDRFYINDYENLKQVVLEEDKGDVIDAMRTWCDGDWDVENLIEVK